MPRFFLIQQATSPRRASKTLENVEPAFRYSLPSEQQAVAHAPPDNEGYGKSAAGVRADGRHFFEQDEIFNTTYIRL
jgi:hypothetical protein